MKIVDQGTVYSLSIRWARIALWPQERPGHE